MALVCSWDSGDGRVHGAIVATGRSDDASCGEFLRRHAAGTEGVGADACGFEFDLVGGVFAVHGFLLGAEGFGFAAALAALTAEREEAEACEDEGGAAGGGVDGYFGGGGEGVEFVADGGLGWLLDVEEEEALGGVATGGGLGIALMDYHGRKINLRDVLNALEASGAVAVLVCFPAGGEIFNIDALHVHVEWHVIEIGFAARPLDDALLVVVFVAACPDAQLDGHRCLGVVLAAKGIFVL